jgi:hypothetical protein
MDDFRKLQAMVIGLVRACPCEPDPVACPLSAIRQLTFRERVAWVKSLPVEDCLQVIQAHAECMEEKGHGESLLCSLASSKPTRP